MKGMLCVLAAVFGCGGLATSNDGDAAVSSDGGGSRGEASNGCVPPPAGLVSWWRGDGNGTDSVGTNTGSTVGSVTYVAGVVGRAFHFDGHSYLTAAASGLPLGTSDRTIELWGRFGGSYDYNWGLFAGYGVWGANYAMNALVLQGIPCSRPANTLAYTQWGNCLPDPTPVTANTWIYMAVTLSALTLTLYVNGEPVDSTPIATGLFSLNTRRGSVYMGAYPNPLPPQGPEWLTGDVDEVSIYSRALSRSEIAGIYAAGSAGKCH